MGHKECPLEQTEHYFLAVITGKGSKCKENWKGKLEKWEKVVNKGKGSISNAISGRLKNCSATLEYMPCQFDKFDNNIEKKLGTQ